MTLLQRSHWPGLLLMAAGLAMYLWAAQRGWHNEITDAHSSRQAQTAITAKLIHDKGLAPLTPFNGLGPPWNVPMEFPLYQILTASVAHLTGGDIVSAGRLTGILGTLVLLPAIWLLLGPTGLGFTGRSFTIGLLLTSPLWLLFSRSILIESWATALAMWWLAAFLQACLGNDENRRWLWAAMGIGVVAGITKVTSFVIVLPIGAVVTLLAWRTVGSAILRRSAAITLPGIVAAVAWTSYADAVKQAHPYAEFLTSANLQQWNWGTWQQRLDPAWWKQTWSHFQQIIPWWCFGFTVPGWIYGTTRQRLAMGLGILAVLTGPLAFANLYFVHNYYFMAVAPLTLAVIGLALGLAWDKFQAVWQRALIAIATIGIGVTQWDAYRDGLGRGQVRERPLPALGLLLNELTQPTDNIVIFGSEWDPLLTWTIDRPVAFVRETYETDEDAWQASRTALGGTDYTVLVAIDSVAGDLSFVRHRTDELGLAFPAAAATARADLYLQPGAVESSHETAETARKSGLVLPSRPERMEPGESRLEFITADWEPVTYKSHGALLDLCRPLPDAIFARFDPARLPAFDQSILHIHPPGGLRFAALSRPRVIHFSYGIRPEIWQNQFETDGVRYRLLGRGPDGQQRLLWSDFVQPLQNPDHRQLLQAKVPLPADTELELWIDAGPDHNPGYDWSAIGELRIE